MKKTTSLMLAGMMILSSLISMVGVGSAGTEGIGAAGAGPDIVISNSYTVSGLETLNNVTVTGTGKLIVPPGATFNVTNIFLQSGSIVEISGGIVNLSSLDPAADVMVNGICSYFNMTDGGIIYMKGSGGSSSLFSSQGGNTNIDIIATEGMKITDSFFTLAGGNGYGPASPWTSGNLNGYVSAGGSSNITLDLTKPGGVMYVNNTSFDLLGGNGGDAADGGLPGGSSGGFSAGGDISGHVGAGGSAFFELLSNNDVSLAQNEITLNGGKGGEAGSAADMIYGPTSGAGGAGYSGGAGSPGLSNTPGQMGGDISDYVGAGGSIMVSIIAEKLVANTTILTANGGNGGNAGDGGNGAGWGSAGGGGYSGGGGGSYWHTEGGNGGAITGNVGSGGSIDIDFNITSIAEINHSNIIAIAGNGGQAGSGGSSTGIHGSGGGGGGYSGGGGGGNGGAAGGEAGHDGGDGGPVSGNVGCGADTNVLLDSDVLIVINTSFDLHGGEAGDGGIAGSNSAGVSCGGGGGGSYSAGGGGGRGYSGLTNGVGGSGGVVSASVGDGGDATLLMQSPKPSISATTQVNLTNGINGNGAASSAPPTVGGEGLGRVTSSGAMTETIPMSIPLLLSPENNSILAVNPTCEWLDLHNSTTNGSLSEYYIEIDNDFDFSSPERTNIMTSANYISVPPLADGIYYWRVTANYSIPIGSNAGWSDVWVFTIGDVPPSPSLTTPATNEHITGVYNITAISDPDSINVNFSYFDGGWHFIGAGIYDSGSGMWYYNWDTAGLNLVDINVTANATDDDPAWGNTTNTGIEIDNTAPTPTLLTPSDNEQIRGVYRTTATSDPDTVSVGFNYSDGLWHNIGFGSYDAGNGSWFYDWDTSGLDLSGVIVSVDAMDEVNLLGTDSNTNIIIDNTDPVITLNSPTNNSVIPAGTALDFDITDAHLNKSNYSINGGANISFSFPFDIDTTDWIDGLYVIEVHANDTVDNNVSKWFNFVVDSTDPLITLNSPVNNSIIKAGTIIYLDVSDDNLDLVTYSVSGGVDQTLNSPYDIWTTSWSDGVQTLELHATDLAGNMAMEIYEFTIDSTSPVIILNSPTNNSVIPPGTIIDLDVTDDHLDTAGYSIDGGTNNNLVSPFDIDTISWSDGLRILEVNGIDEAGNYAAVSYLFIIDSSSPTIALNSPANNSIIQKGTLIDFDVMDENLDSVDYSINSDVEHTFGSPYDIDTTGWTDGIYTIEVHAIDIVGNTAIHSYTFKIDSTAPKVISTIPANNSEDIAWDTTITIEFNEPMDPSSVSNSLSTSPAVSISGYSWNNDNTILTITFSSNLTENTRYSITIGTGAKDITGNSLASNYIWSFTTQIDTDDDGIPDLQDTDDDGDGVPDSEDAFPFDPTEDTDTDADGIGNNADTDDDNDDVPDIDDPDPLDPTITGEENIGEYWWIILIIVIVLTVMALVVYFKKRKSPPIQEQESLPPPPPPPQQPPPPNQPGG